ncbi:uncharacterized protein PGTG_15024 [Puccinia graminis f. sp. tritici CRL 75-36-700-3]|uniref:Uncharacterized protein n=1 Tax=Puccinia graminis f. sp. tritici (strain CRL 75-36-700-3 / race SCCL) TaxID=418459 RepID=E3KXY2_PUCGT|nr:uncharacterized protein PGTG_15024 [Puccinia graminis f. sp. tritici CRL 75-36-700-3]EFP89183.2 hypothetical protein PGTG_15024 [Puccinia graminis f. sp. tritici CRL 75-36-700-3]
MLFVQLFIALHFIQPYGVFAHTVPTFVKPLKEVFPASKPLGKLDTAFRDCYNLDGGRFHSPPRDQFPPILENLHSTGIPKRQNRDPKRRVTWDESPVKVFEIPKEEPEPGEEIPQYVKRYVQKRWQWRHIDDFTDDERKRKYGTRYLIGSNRQIHEYTEFPTKKVNFKGNFIRVPADFPPPSEEKILPPEFQEGNLERKLSPTEYRNSFEEEKDEGKAGGEELNNSGSYPMINEHSVNKKETDINENQEFDEDAKHRKAGYKKVSTSFRDQIIGRHKETHISETKKFDDPNQGKAGSEKLSTSVTDQIDTSYSPKIKSFKIGNDPLGEEKFSENKNGGLKEKEIQDPEPKYAKFQNPEDLKHKKAGYKKVSTSFRDQIIGRQKETHISETKKFDGVKALMTKSLNIYSS